MTKVRRQSSRVFATDGTDTDVGTIPDSAVRQAVDVVKAYLRQELIVEGCRKAPCFGCASCEAVSLEHRLDALLAVI